MCRTYARFDGWGLVLERRIAEEHIKRYGEGCGGYVASEFWIWTLTTAMAGLVFACLSKKEGSHEFCILESRAMDCIHIAFEEQRKRRDEGRQNKWELCGFPHLPQART
jgi:hypothetical protein